VINQFLTVTESSAIATAHCRPRITLLYCVTFNFNVFNVFQLLLYLCSMIKKLLLLTVSSIILVYITQLQMQQHRVKKNK